LICSAIAIRESIVLRSDWLSGHACETSRWVAYWTVGPLSSGHLNTRCAIQCAKADPCRCMRANRKLPSSMQRLARRPSRLAQICRIEVNNEGTPMMLQLEVCDIVLL
jgi:hypothetical protein